MIEVYDKGTGAILFKKTPQERKVEKELQETKKLLQELLKKVETLGEK